MRAIGLMDNMFVKLHALQANTTYLAFLRLVPSVHQVRLLQELMQSRLLIQGATVNKGIRITGSHCPGSLSSAGAHSVAIISTRTSLKVLPAKHVLIIQDMLRLHRQPSVVALAMRDITEQTAARAIRVEKTCTSQAEDLPAPTSVLLIQDML
jgi:hypothetical protein